MRICDTLTRIQPTKRGKIGKIAAKFYSVSHTDASAQLQELKDAAAVSESHWFQCAENHRPQLLAQISAAIYLTESRRSPQNFAAALRDFRKGGESAEAFCRIFCKDKSTALGVLEELYEFAKITPTDL